MTELLICAKIHDDSPEHSTMADNGNPRLRVLDAWHASDCVRAFRLAAVDGDTLAPWEPGAHLELILPSGLVRQYSLCGDPADHGEYQIAVLRDPDSRGGSIQMHDDIGPGDELEFRGPRNHFAFQPAAAYLFIAGGVGITPLLPMIAQAERRGTPWRLVYGGRSRTSMAFLDRFDGFDQRVVDVVAQDERGLPDLSGEIGAAPADALIYACGPEGLLCAVEQTCREAGRGRVLHLERFAAATETLASIPADTDFEVQLNSTGQVIPVPVGTTILEAVRTVLPETMSSCEEGFCGTCETRVLAGIPDHRDTLLSEDERAANDTMMICVSRAGCARLVLDL